MVGLARRLSPVTGVTVSLRSLGHAASRLRTFHGNGYAWIHPIGHCSDSHLSLEFVSDSTDGLLLHSGASRDSKNFIAVEITSGRLLLIFRQDLTPLRLGFPEQENITD
ncbi:putative neural-cadherin 2 [Spea bombifrons]|uniref:putative neural-cadherin 2 n=1 Tax=Spea bombifrons TaxID=233779 RepID=UPI00234978E5|nr:putative neural-cadherin 2 [Spea bombifrons]